MKNYYEILEVSFSASIEEIKKAYRQKAIKYHPDKHFGDNYFTEKFIEIKEAYDILSDQNERIKYDIEYRMYFSKNEPQEKQTFRENKKKETEKEESFFYDPYKPFYSYQDRIVNETPQFNPIINHWGEKLSNDSDFFKLPKNIGKIISGYTTLSTIKKTETFKEKNGCYFISIIISLIFSSVIILLFGITDLTGIVISIILPLLLLIGYAYYVNSNSYKHTCNFIGVNGFAEYVYDKKRDILVKSFEINFNDITDFLFIITNVNSGKTYSHTDYLFIWLNNNKLVKRVSGTYSNEKNTPDRASSNEYWLNLYAEKYWTVYLLDKMEYDLETKGYIEFKSCWEKNEYFESKKYIQLGIGYITFKTDKGDVKYNFNDIKKVYTKYGFLYFEHKNYEKKYYFFETGNKNGISLLNLSNKKYFYKALELLLGYKVL